MAEYCGNCGGSGTDPNTDERCSYCDSTGWAGGNVP